VLQILGKKKKVVVSLSNYGMITIKRCGRRLGKSREERKRKSRKGEVRQKNCILKKGIKKQFDKSAYGIIRRKM
jgi:hypothetical protein